MSDSQTASATATANSMITDLQYPLSSSRILEINTKCTIASKHKSRQTSWSHPQVLTSKAVVSLCPVKPESDHDWGSLHELDCLPQSSCHLWDVPLLHQAHYMVNVLCRCFRTSLLNSPSHSLFALACFRLDVSGVLIAAIACMLHA